MGEPAELQPFEVRSWLNTHPEGSISSFKFTQPTRIGRGWTKTGRNISYEDDKGLQAVSLPQAPIDLNLNIDACVPKEEDTCARVEVLIAAVHAAGASMDSIPILTYRNNLNKLLGTAVDARSPWQIDACYHGTTLFLEIVAKKAMEWQNTEQARRTTAWGYQFEAKCTGGKPAAGNANNEYGILVATQLGDNLKLCIGAEIDGYIPDKNAGLGELASPVRLVSLCELKTFKPPAHQGQMRTLYKFKHPTWWIQSFLAGVPTMVLGERDGKGVIHAIHVVKVSDLHKISRKNGESWDGHRILAFGAAALEWMASVAQGPGWAGHHVHFTYDPDTGLINPKRGQGDLPQRIRDALNTVC